MISKDVRFLTLLATFSVAACGVTDEVFVPGELSEAEAVDMAGAMLIATFQTTVAPPQQPSQVNGPAAVEFDYASDFSAVVACGLGGDVAIAADFNVTGETDLEVFRAAYTMVQTHNGCVVESEDGRQFTLWGNPDLTFTVVVEGDGINEVVEWGGHVEGTVDWQTDGREGSCVVAFEFGGSVRGQSDSVAGNLGGTACGVEFNREFSIGVSSAG